MRTVVVLLTGMAAALGAAMWGVFSSVCVFVPQPFTTEKKGRTLSMTRVVLVFAFVLLALPMALPQIAFAQGAGKALHFDGTDDYVSLPNITLWDFGKGSFSISVWFKSNVSGHYNDMIRYDNGMGNGLWGVRFDTNAKVEFLIADGDGRKVSGITTTGSWADNNWHFVTAVRDSCNGQLRIYIDGSSAAAPTPDGGRNVEAHVDAYPAIGRCGSYGGSYFCGLIDEVRIWNVARTQAQIRANMCKKLTGSESGLVGYWRLDESSGTSCTDSSPNTNTGTMTNMDPGTDRVWSGAAIGDASAHDYSSTDGYTVNLASSDNDDITATTTSGTVTGIQVFRVDEAPNVTTAPGNLVQLSPRHYFGVFPIGTSVQYTVTYDYDGHPGINDESTLDLAKRADNSTTSWTEANASIDQGNNTLTLTGQTGTEYILGSESSDNSLPVELTSFIATPGDGEVTLRWVTESEVDNLGFYVYRALEENGPYERITSERIPGAGSTPTRQTYSFTDRDVVNGITYWYKLEDVAFDGTRTVHGPIAITPQSSIPDRYDLSVNVPNPFNPQTTIAYQLAEASSVKLTIYNTAGQVISILVDEAKSAGTYSVVWDGLDQAGRKVASGVYLYELRAEDFVKVRKMALLR